MVIEKESKLKANTIRKEELTKKYNEMYEVERESFNSGKEYMDSGR